MDTTDTQNPLRSTDRARRARLRALAPLSAAVLLAAGCAAPQEAPAPAEGTAAATTAAEPAAPTATATSSAEEGAASSSAGHEGHGHAHADHPADGGPAPAGIRTAESPEYPVGTEVTLAADHMPGMDGATATVVGAFDTVTYAVTYTPTDGGPEVEDHKWVVQEELRTPDGAQLPPRALADGAEVTIEADHMAGMHGAQGTVDSSTTEPVYMVDYTADGMQMRNHKWVVESELQPAG
ncbi:YdhK family protein [Micrococcus sp.]|uniref:YdhK family protein n=1 Tax=Micrococcus sp. TaxID=1271 RepID=UPI002A909A8F|nr:YdhK family protein [Micrococcus sp.]MDY6054980.1 YdhK family protein [Micrococcus sp.]